MNNFIPTCEFRWHISYIDLPFARQAKTMPFCELKVLQQWYSDRTKPDASGKYLEGEWRSIPTVYVGKVEIMA